MYARSWQGVHLDAGNLHKCHKAGSRWGGWKEKARSPNRNHPATLRRCARDHPAVRRQDHRPGDASRGDPPVEESLAGEPRTPASPTQPTRIPGFKSKTRPVENRGESSIRWPSPSPRGSRPHHHCRSQKAQEDPHQVSSIGNHPLDSPAPSTGKNNKNRTIGGVDPAEAMALGLEHRHHPVQGQGQEAGGSEPGAAVIPKPQPHSVATTDFQKTRCQEEKEGAHGARIARGPAHDQLRPSAVPSSLSPRSSNLFPGGEDGKWKGKGLRRTVKKCGS